MLGVGCGNVCPWPLEPAASLCSLWRPGCWQNLVHAQDCHPQRGAGGPFPDPAFLVTAESLCEGHGLPLAASTTLRMLRTATRSEEQVCLCRPLNPWLWLKAEELHVPLAFSNLAASRASHMLSGIMLGVHCQHASHSSCRCDQCDPGFFNAPAALSSSGPFCPGRSVCSSSVPISPRSAALCAWLPGWAALSIAEPG